MAKAPLVKIVELTNATGFPRRYTVADGTAISKGILLQVADPRTASEAGFAGIPAGIAWMDKEANDGSTSITALTDCIAEIRASGAITVGQNVVLAGQNEVMAATEANVASGAKFLALGYALETATDQEVINVRVKV